MDVHIHHVTGAAAGLGRHVRYGRPSFGYIHAAATALGEE